MATTIDQNQPHLIESGPRQVFTNKVPPSTLVPMGTLAMTDASGRPVPFDATTYQAGGRGFLGVAVQRVANDGVSEITKRAMFFRSVDVVLAGAAGDAPDATYLGRTVAVKDNISVKKTVVAGDFTVVITEILANGKFRVWI